MKFENEPFGQKDYGLRQIPRYDVSDYQKALHRAKKSFQNKNFNQAFDIYDQLTLAHSEKAIPILAEVYDKYQLIPERDRYLFYQSRFFNFGIKPTDKVLDIGSGNVPFQLATHLADITIEDDNYGRAGVPFKNIDGKPFFECNIENLPFKDKEFDFVYCSHVLEHVTNPEKACDELTRIAKRGYIETPKPSKDLWLNNAKVSHHRWAVENINSKLVFTEYSKEEIDGLQHDILRRMATDPQTIREKAFSSLIHLKAPLFNTMLLWEDSFEYKVRRLTRQQEMRSLVTSCGLKTIPNITSCKARSFQEPKFSFVMIVLNGMPFIEYSLKSVYDFAHEIIIVEGAVEKCMFAANPDGSSTDGTVEFIKSFPDTQNKIRLIQGKWPEKCEMQNEALKYVTGDYVWLIDSDEVYKREDLEKIKEVLKADPSITQVNFIPDSFWKGPNYIFVSPEFFKQWCHFRRLFKYITGAVFTSHRPPTMLWPGSDKTTEQIHLLDGTKTRQMGIIFYHYSYVLDKQVKQKIELYHRYGWGENWNIDLLEWYNECFLKWTPENRQEIDSKYPIWTGDRDSHTLHFTGTHPEVMKDFVEKYYDSKTAIEQPSASKTPDFTPVSPKNRDSSYNEMLEKIIKFSKSIPEDKLKNEIISVTVDSTEFALQKLGTHYGGWVVPVNKIFSDSICYCVGAGEDISFDIELINRFGCEVFIFDPTPRAQAHIKMLEEYTHNGQKMPINNSETDFYEIHEGLLDKIKFFPYGIWSKSEVKKFFAPRNPEHVSNSILNLQKTTKCFEAQCLTINNAMKRLGHEKIDLLKIDIEGAEYEVINSIIKDNIEIGILCVEFDELNSPSDQNFKERIENSIKRLSEANFVPLFVDGADYTFINADILLAHEAMAHPKLTKMNLPERLLRRPQYLKIETTNICNANCTFCMYRFMKREKNIMPMELFKKVVDDYVAAGGGALTMSPLVGDCLVDSKLLERLRYCRNFNEITHIGFHTNMVGLNRWTDEQILEILDLIDVWNCSIGPNRDVYKDMFGVDQFERVIANLERFHRLLNLSEYKPLVQLNGRAAGGVFEKDERLRRLSLAITGKEMTWMTSYMDWGGLLQELPRNTKIIKTAGYTNKQSPCMKGLISAVVFCDGRVGFCGCADYDAILTIGDINKERLGKILAGKQRQEIMASFGKSGLNKYCQKCSFYQPVDLKWISKWIPGTNPHHLVPVRPSLQRNIKTAAKARMADFRRNLPISEGKSETRNAEKNRIIQAQNLLGKGHILKALKEFENVLTGSPDTIDAHLGRAVCLARLGRLLEAEVEAKNALSKDSQNPRLLQFAEQMRRLKPDLIGDRDVEWGHIISRINEMAKIQSNRARILDFGCGQSAQLARSIARLGCQITAIDMMPLTVSLDSTQNINFIQGDFLRRDWTPQSFDLIINCSSIEHSGLVGRYGVVEEGPDDDLEIMAQMGRLIKPDGKMLLTIPVGLDKVVGSLHRVYGQTRLAKLLDGWEIESSCFWIKDENNQWRQVDEESALQREPMLAYALGCFVLRPAVRINLPGDSTLVPIYGQKLGVTEHSKGKTTVSVTASTKSISPTFKQAPKILIVRTDGIGDFVIFSGALPYYRKLYPNSHITIIVRECSTELA
ncbi:MAG: methyltransferase domain-containing protein, partial [Candidatus Hodarchaeota archaeon]